MRTIWLRSVTESEKVHEEADSIKDKICLSLKDFAIFFCLFHNVPGPQRYINKNRGSYRYLDQWFSTFFGWRHTFLQNFFCGTPKTRKISKMASKNFSFCIKLLGFETWLLHTIPVFLIFETKMINSC